MTKKYLPEVCEIQYGFPFDSAQFSTSEGMPLIRIRDVVRGYSETFTTEIYKDEYIVHENDLLIGMDGEFNIAKWGETPALLNQRVCRLFPLSEEVDKNYLFYFMPTALKQIEEKTPFVTVKHLSAKELNKIVVPLPSMEEQRRIAAVLDKVTDLIDKRRQQLDKLDLLVKSRFVEMFGDPVKNEKNWPIVEIGELAEVRIGPFGSLLHKEDYINGGHALVNPSHIIDGEISVDQNLSVSDEKYDELRAYQLKVGDVVLGRRGEMGRCAVVRQEGLLCGTGSMIIRPKNLMKPYFLQNIISSPTYKKVIEDKAVGVTMMNLNVPIVSALTVPLLPLNLQEKFIDLLESVNGLKGLNTYSLNKLEILKKSIMQQYFG